MFKVFNFLCNFAIFYLVTSYTISKNFKKQLKFPGHTLFSTSSVVELTKDGGVKKTVIIPGQGRKVETGDILAVEYTATLKGGNVFAKGDKEQFILKDGSFIRGWDVGVSSMQVGEKAKIYVSPSYGYGSVGISPVIPPNSEIEIDVKIQAWLGNQLRPETLFQKDLDIDPFISSTPEAIQADYDDMQSKKEKKDVSIVELYLKRFRNISFGFGGSGFFTSQSGQAAPWYLNPNLTFPSMIAFCLVAFLTVFSSGAVKEKGVNTRDLDVASINSIQRITTNTDTFA